MYISYSLQVEASATRLNTNDVFVLKTPNSMFMWKGIGATAEEMAAAKYVCSFLGGSATDVAEGKEPGGIPVTHGHSETFKNLAVAN